MLTIGRIFAGDGWRYLWDQVAGDAGDYYLLDVGRGETPGRWAGRAAWPELGLTGRVTEEQMRQVFGRLAQPATAAPLGRPPRRFRSIHDRLRAARAAHDRDQTARWAQREVALLESGASRERIDDELAAFRARSAENWAVTEATIRRGGQRQAVAGFDLTYSAPKSVSVLWAAAPAEGRQKIWDAHHEGVAAAMRFVEREAALSRTGYDGVRQVDTTGLITSTFDHRMSRAGDVHVHTHTAVLNRVRCSDGEWRSLDGRAVYRVAAAAGAIYDRVREAALERDLGVRHQLDRASGAREIVGVDPDVRRLFSSRRVQIEGRLDELVAAWRDEHGSDPSEWMVTRMAEWARLETRAPKGPGETTPTALARWDVQARAELGRSLASVWDAATHPNDTEDFDGADDGPAGDDELLAGAVRAVERAKSTWTRYDLARELTRRIPVDPARPAEALARVDRLIAHALQADNPCGVVSLAAPAPFTVAASLRRASDDTSIYTEHGADRYTTNAGLGIERRLVATARDTTGPRLDPATIETAISDLDSDQATAVTAVLTSGRRLDVLVGPAGSGKTTTMRAVARAWQAAGRQVLGVSIAENATRILAAHAGIAAVNAAKLIFEHSPPAPHPHGECRSHDAYAIRAGGLVILDEAGMASRRTIDRLAAICARAGAKLLLVGDPEQLPSPDAAGTFELLATQTGAATLGRVRRFRHPWEGAASLRLRQGDPTVLAEYDRRGRITGGSPADVEDAALTAALADRARGLTVYLLADTNDTAARLARRVRDHLVAAGQVEDTRTAVLADSNHAGVGDQIVTRDNDRTNRSDDGRFVANRDLWTVHAVRDDGSLQVVRVDTDQTVELDRSYVAERVQLAYASTIHAAQGGTCDAAHTVLTPRSTRTSVYVGLTRGRAENHAYVVCSRPEGADQDGPAEDPLAVLAAVLDRPEPPDGNAALQVQADEATRAVSLATLYPIWQDLLARHGARTAEDALAAVGGPDLADVTLRSPAWPALAARLRRLQTAGIDLAAALAAAAAQPLDDADDLAAVLHWRLRHKETATTSPAVTFTALTLTGPSDLTETARQVAVAMDTRTVTLARHVETNPPLWVETLGPRPTDSTRLQAWLDRAGVVAGYREAFGITTPDDPIGPPPPQSRTDALAWWTRAATTLIHSETRTLAALPTERLEAIVDHAHTTCAAAPPAVADQLQRTAVALRAAQTRQGAATAHGDIALARAAGAEAARLARQLDRLEHGQALRDRWNLTANRLDAQAGAAQAVLDDRHTTQRARPHSQVDTATLVRRLRDARHHADHATVTAQHYDRRTDRTTPELAALVTQIDHTINVEPAYTQARRTVTSEQHAAARIADIRASLDTTRLGLHTIRGPYRAQLNAELTRLRTQHPALADGTNAERWDTLLAAGKDADRNTLAQLRSRHQQAATDLDWYRNTATQLRADADNQQTTITGIRDELTTRTSTPHDPRTPRPRPPQSAPYPRTSVSAVAQDQITTTPKPPQDSPGAGPG